MTGGTTLPSHLKWPCWQILAMPTLHELVPHVSTYKVVFRRYKVVRKPSSYRLLRRLPQYRNLVTDTYIYIYTHTDIDIDTHITNLCHRLLICVSISISISMYIYIYTYRSKTRNQEIDFCSNGSPQKTSYLLVKNSIWKKMETPCV